MLNIKNELLADLSSETAANINGGQAEQGEQGGKEDKSKFNYNRYLKALGISYLSPPEVGSITDKEALLAQYQGWED
ncbi:hypothetical protein [Anabaena sp. UHCC 0451]|uniref:hypothetical protein n=1 Tax=Anabaena sp. UHCC 0451 TaxID=2055235 RepID=UPI002B20FBDA|nr:hypothetical protein [Anabaena sp. UHCC 0451]MEA5578844.1 hypothetical protein [Anabaena sp. UHCC 0451]